MEVSEKYVVHKLNPLFELRGSNSPLMMTLEKIEFKGMVSNSFDTEKEAILALIEDGKTWEEFIILKQVFIRT
jgi:hypothetical protein